MDEFNKDAFRHKKRKPFDGRTSFVKNPKASHHLRSILYQARE